MDRLKSLVIPIKETAKIILPQFQTGLMTRNEPFVLQGSPKYRVDPSFFATNKYAQLDKPYSSPLLWP